MMNQARAAVSLKIIASVLFILGTGAHFLWLLSNPDVLLVDVWTLAYLPVDIAYFAGAIYVLANFQSFIHSRRVQLIKGLIVLFCIDVMYGIAGAIYQITSPESAFVDVVPFTQSEVITWTVVGIGVDALITFALIQLINIAAGKKPKLPPRWQTIGAWCIVAIIVIGTILYASLS